MHANRCIFMLVAISTRHGFCNMDIQWGSKVFDNIENLVFFYLFKNGNKQKALKF